MPKPQRIFITGIAGSGKTTLARRLASETGYIHLDIDQIRHPRSGVRTDPAEIERAIKALVHQADWVADGVPASWTKPLLAAADLIIWTDTSGRRSAYQILQRYAVRRIQGNWPFRMRSTLRLAHGALTSRRPPHRRLGRPAGELPWHHEVRLALEPYADKVVRLESVAAAQRFRLEKL